MNQFQNDPPLSVSADNQSLSINSLSFLSLDSNPQFSQQQSWMASAIDQPMRNEINDILKELHKIQDPERIEKIMNKVFSFECYGQKQADLQRQLKEQELIKAKQQKELQDLKRQLMAAQAKVNGIKKGKKQITQLMARRGQYTQSLIDLMNAGIKQQPEIRKPTQQQRKKHKQVNQKLAAFYQQRNSMKQASIRALRDELMTTEREISILEQQKKVLGKAREQILEQKTNSDAAIRIKQLKQGINKLKRYVKKNRHLILE